MIEGHHDVAAVIKKCEIQLFSVKKVTVPEREPSTLSLHLYVLSKSENMRRVHNKGQNDTF